MRVVDARAFDIPSDENDYDELVAFADTMASIEQFDAYTKEEVIAMLTELKLEIEELDVSDVVPEYQDGAEETREHIANTIEEKINSLKED